MLNDLSPWAKTIDFNPLSTSKKPLFPSIIPRWQQRYYQKVVKSSEKWLGSARLSKVAVMLSSGCFFITARVLLLWNELYCSFRAVNPWHALTLEIIFLQSLNSFKVRLDKHSNRQNFMTHQDWTTCKTLLTPQKIPWELQAKFNAISRTVLRPA